jgi:creatinine amidohydrolase/Fe(II)-dependent formamide hydrolase-like protein
MKTHRLWILLATLLAPRAVYAQIYRLAEMNSDQVRGLDHEKTVILIPGGILEEHGPYLPTYTDGYADRYYTQKLANAIAARPGWKVVVFPEIPLGFGGANNIGAKWDFPGTYTVRLSTLRSVYMDLASDLGAQKFRWILVVHDHGDPAHNQALAQASDYFHDMYGGTMLHLFGLTEVQGCYDIVAKLPSKKASAQDGFTVHAGAEEHSEILFLHPELANPAYKTAPFFTGKNFDDLYNLAEKDGWPGYFGAPHRASASLGRQVMEACSQKLDAVALRVLDGLDYRELPRFYDKLDPRDAIGDKAERNHDREIERKQQQWLKAKGIE